MKSKILATALVVLLLFSVFGITAFAADDVVEDASAETYSIVFKYAEDSTAFKGMSYSAYVDPATFAVGFEIVEDLPFGHVIYDDPDTSYIDGIRINGNTVDSLKVTLDGSLEYVVDVRTVYEDNLLGDVAKIIDGKFDFKTLLENPVLMLAGIYYILCIASVVLASFTTALSKSKKVKTADEIAAKVDESADCAIAKVKTEVTNTVLAEMTPMLQRILDDMQNVVKAIVLSTAHTKEAPLAMLDALQDAAEATNVKELMDEIRKKVSENINIASEKHEINVETLHEISKTGVSTEPTPEESAQKLTNNSKSVF